MTTSILQRKTHVFARTPLFCSILFYQLLISTLLKTLSPTCTRPFIYVLACEWQSPLWRMTCSTVTPHHVHTKPWHDGEAQLNSVALEWRRKQNIHYRRQTNKKKIRKIQNSWRHHLLLEKSNHLGSFPTIKTVFKKRTFGLTRRRYIHIHGRIAHVLL